MKKSAVQIKEYGGSYYMQSKGTSFAKAANKASAPYLLIPKQFRDILNCEDIEIYISDGVVCVRRASIDSSNRRKLHGSISLPQKFMDFIGVYAFTVNEDDNDEFELVPL